MNGHMGKDVTVGRGKCKGVSVIDYAICSPVLSHLVREFYVNDFDASLSDLLSVSLVKLVIICYLIP